MTIDKERRIKVTNRTSGSLAYYIDTLRVTRHWRKPGDYLNISIGELLELKTAPGGRTILSESIVIEDKEALKVLFPDMELEPEYHYGLDEVDSLLYSATNEQFLDALDYAPKGVLELIKKKAVEKLPNTTNKVTAINEKFDIDLSNVHELNKGIERPDETEKPKRKRRATPITEEPAIETPKYNVIRKEE